MITKLELKKQLKKLGVVVKGNHIRKKDVEKIVAEKIVAEKVDMNDLIKGMLNGLSDTRIEEKLLSTKKSMKEYLRLNPNKIGIVINNLFSLSQILFDLSSRVERRRKELIKGLSEQIKEMDIKIKSID